MAKIIYEISDATIPQLTEALCNFNRVHGMLIPAYQPMVTVDDPENEEQTIETENPMGPGTYALNVVADFVKGVLNAYREIKKEESKREAIKFAIAQVENDKNKELEVEMAAIDTSVNFSVE